MKNNKAPPPPIFRFSGWAGALASRRCQGVFHQFLLVKEARKRRANHGWQRRNLQLYASLLRLVHVACLAVHGRDLL